METKKRKFRLMKIDHFIWNAHMILRGHRSVVNQVRYSSRLHTIVSSGVEKIIKVRTSLLAFENIKIRQFSLDVDTLSNAK